MAFDLGPVHALVDDRVLGDVPRVDAHQRDLLPIAAPPVAAQLAELLLRDVVGEAERQAVLGLVGQAGQFAALAVEHVQIAIAHKRDAAAIGAERGLDRRFGVRQLGGVAVAHDDSQERAAGDQQDGRVGVARPRVGRDAEFAGAGALAAQLFFARQLAGGVVGADQDAAFAGLEIDAPERSHEAARRAVEPGQGAAVGHEADACGAGHAGPRVAGDLREGEALTGHADSASRRSASISSASLGRAALSTSQPSAVTSTSSSMRIPPNSASELSSASMRSQFTCSR